MENTVIVVSSVTYAMKSRDLLASHGIRAYVERVARTPSTGCGYGVYVPEETDEAEEILRSHGVRILSRAAHRKKDSV